MGMTVGCLLHSWHRITVPKGDSDLKRDEGCHFKKNSKWQPTLSETL